MLLLAAGLVLAAGPAHAATLTVSVDSSSIQCQNGTNNDTNESGTCAQNGSGTSDDWAIAWGTSYSGPANQIGPGSDTTTFSINGLVAADDGGADIGQGGDRWVKLDFDITLDIVVDTISPSASWVIDMSQSVLGLYALRGDGGGSAVGNQDDGLVEMTDVVVVVDGTGYNVDVAANSYSSDCSGGCSKSQQFSGSRTDNAILSGTGDAAFTATVSFNLEALSNDGCSGFICSSASGGEEAAVLFGIDDQIDQGVDNYSNWGGRNVANDGYDMTFNFSIVPEPGTLLLGLIAGLVTAGLVRRR